MLNPFLEHHRESLGPASEGSIHHYSISPVFFIKSSSNIQISSNKNGNGSGAAGSSSKMSDALPHDAATDMQLTLFHCAIEMRAKVFL